MRTTKRHSSSITSCSLRPPTDRSQLLETATANQQQQQQQTAKRKLNPPSTSLHLRRRSEAQVILSHPIISRSIQDLHNQPNTTTTHPQSSNSQPPPKPPSAHSSAIPSSSSSTRRRPITTPPSTVTITHGLPSPPTTIASENGSIFQPTTHSEIHRAPNRVGSVNDDDRTRSERRVAATISHHSTLTSPRPNRKTQYPRTPTVSVPTPPSSRITSTRSTQHSSVSSNRIMKPSKRDSLPVVAHTTHFNPIRASTDPSHPRPPSTSASLASKPNQPIIRQSPTISHAYQRLAPLSRRSSTADGRMSSHSSYSEFTTSSNHRHSAPQDTPTELSTSLLSNATVKPHRTPSESSSTDLRASKFKLKDRSKDPSVPALNEQSCSLPRSKRLIGMKERNERIFASINASLNSPPRTHPPEPSLPPPPPSASSGSSNSSSSSLLPPSSPKRSSGNLRVPGSHHIRSGLIPFAKGCSPSPRKITSHGSHPQTSSNGRMDNLPPKPTDPEPESIDDDEKYGSVRHKRPERSRLVKRTSPVGNSEADPISPSHSERTKMSHHIDQGRRQIDPKTEQYLKEATDPPTSGDIAQSHRNSRTWSESISMHTSSSDTIGARDSRTAMRSASKSSAVDSQTNSSRHSRTSRYWEDEQNDYSDRDEGEDETMTTPVKVRRSESFQKTLRNASSVTEMLNSRNSHVEIAPVSRTAKGPVGRRRRSSSSKGERTLELSGLPLEDSPPRLSKTLNQSPQSNRSISRRQRPGLPGHFVQPSQSERTGSERIHSLAEIRHLEPHSSLSPRSNRTRPSTGLRPQQTSDSRSHRHSDTFAIVPDRLNGVESALSRYDGHHIHSSETRHQSIRNKHASWSGLDDVGGDLIRSQSVLGGVYDPHTAQRRGTTNRHRTAFPSPISRRTIVYHHNGVDDDDDGQTSTTTYTNTQSMPRKADSAGSRSRTSEWAFEDHQDSNPRSVRASSRMGGNSLILSPSRSRLIGERDRTLRGNGGAAVPQPKPFAQLLRNTYQDKNSPSHNADNRSSSSGASSKLLQSQRALVHRQLSSAKLNDNLNRSTRPPTRATSSTAGGLTALLSPTPTVDHHRLLISAYEALDHTPDDCSPEATELNSALNGLLSSVVKNCCKIDAALAELNESSVNHQVEMELVDDYIDSQADENDTYSKREPPAGQVTKQKYRMMKDNLAHMSKVQGQLVRSSNDQIRDLTEVLICLSKLQRSQKEHLGSRQQPSRASVIDDSRDSYGYGEPQQGEIFRSGSRASKKYSHSHSPSKLRHIVDLSPLSVISSNDESPLSRAKPNGANESSRHSVNNRSGRAVKSPNGFGPQHQRASTISFTHNRELSFDGVNYQQVRAKNRMSAMSSASICHMGESFYQASNGSTSQSRRKEPHPDIDEFGLYRKASEHTLRSPAEPKEHHPRPESAWSRADTTAGHTIRGSQSSTIFPKTPPRLPTSSISQTTAHSNVSPTNPFRHVVDNETPHTEMNSKHPIRPQSSMSKILHRANSVLSRVEHYPAVSTLPSGRKQTQEAWDRCSRETSIDDSRPPSRHPPEPPHSHSRSRQPSQPAERTLDLQSESSQRQAGHRRTGPPPRSSTMATTALERLSRIGNRSRVEQYHDEQEDVDQLHGLRRSSTSSYLASSGPECDDDLDQQQHQRPFNPSSSSASSSSAAFNSNHHHHHHSNQKYQTNHHLNQSTTDHHSNNSTSMTTTNTNTTSNSNSSTGLSNHLGSGSNHRRRKGSIQSLFNGLKRSSTIYVKK